jgi:hypothetical protein
MPGVHYVPHSKSRSPALPLSRSVARPESSPALPPPHHPPTPPLLLSCCPCPQLLSAQLHRRTHPHKKGTCGGGHSLGCTTTTATLCCSSSCCRARNDAAYKMQGQQGGGCTHGRANTAIQLGTGPPWRLRKYLGCIGCAATAGERGGHQGQLALHCHHAALVFDHLVQQAPLREGTREREPSPCNDKGLQTATRASNNYTNRRRNENTIMLWRRTVMRSRAAHKSPSRCLQGGNRPHTWATGSPSPGCTEVGGGQACKWPGCGGHQVGGTHARAAPRSRPSKGTTVPANPFLGNKTTPATRLGPMKPRSSAHVCRWGRHTMARNGVTTANNLDGGEGAPISPRQEPAPIPPRQGPSS